MCNDMAAWCRAADDIDIDIDIDIEREIDIDIKAFFRGVLYGQRKNKSPKM